MNSGFETTTISNFEDVEARQKATWEAGDFGHIARTFENVAEDFTARQSLPAGAQVLDVARRAGNLAVVAARRGGVVSSIDIAANLIAEARSWTKGRTRPWMLNPGVSLTPMAWGSRRFECRASEGIRAFSHGASWVYRRWCQNRALRLNMRDLHYCPDLRWVLYLDYPARKAALASRWYVRCWK